MSSSHQDQKAIIGSGSEMGGSLDSKLNLAGKKVEHTPLMKNRATNAISSHESLVHLVKMNVGIGVLAMPTAFYNAGTAVGIAGMTFMAVITVHCMHLLVNAGQLMTKRLQAEFLDYAEVVDAAFASVDAARRFQRHARIGINIALCIGQVGGFAVYILFIAKNLQSLMHSMYAFDLDYRVYLLILLPPTVLICSVRNLHYLTPVTVLANLFEFYTLGVVFYYLFSPPVYSFDSLPILAKWEQLPIFFGTAMFTFEGIGIILPLENKMRTPSDMRGWSGVLNTAMVSVACMYIAVGFFGYLKFGPAVEGKGSVTLNLPQKEFLADSARGSISLAILFSNPLQFYVAISIMFPALIAHRVRPQRLLLAEYALRYTVIAFCFLLAALVPDLDLFISWSGAIVMPILSIIMPCMLDILVGRLDDNGNQGRSKWRRTRTAKNVCLIVFGMAGSIFGTIMSTIDIVKRHSG